MAEHLDEALDFILTFARPSDLSLSSDEASWREFDSGEISKEELARRIGVWHLVESEMDRLARAEEHQTDERKIADLHEDLVRIFGDELGEIEAALSPDGWPIIRSAAGDRIYFREGGPTSVFARHRKVGDRVEATLWNRAGIRVGRQALDLPADGGWFR
jgi:hypothetical protein